MHILRLVSYQILKIFACSDSKRSTKRRLECFRRSLLGFIPHVFPDMKMAFLICWDICSSSQMTFSFQLMSSSEDSLQSFITRTHCTCEGKAFHIYCQPSVNCGTVLYFYIGSFLLELNRLRENSVLLFFAGGALWGFTESVKGIYDKLAFLDFFATFCIFLFI